MNTNTQSTLTAPDPSEFSEVDLLRRKLQLSMSLVQQLMTDRDSLKRNTPDLTLLFMGVAGNA